MRSLAEEGNPHETHQRESLINQGQHSSALSSPPQPAGPRISTDQPPPSEDQNSDPPQNSAPSAAPAPAPAPALPPVNEQLAALMSALRTPVNAQEPAKQPQDVPNAPADPAPVKGQPAAPTAEAESTPPFGLPIVSRVPGQPLPPAGARKAKADTPKLPVKEEQRSAVGYGVAVPVHEQPLPPVKLSADAPAAGMQAPLDRDPAPQTPLNGAPARKPEATAPPVQETSTQPEDLTFAARVQPVGSVQKAALSTSAAGAVAPAVNSKKVIESDVQDAPRAADPGPAAGKFAAAFESNGRLTPPPPDAPSTPSKPVEAAVPVTPALPKPAAQPLKDLSLQMSQPGVEKVEIRLVQQAGELHVAVRTGDSEMAHGLRQNLPELVGHLEDNGFHTEAWRPGVSAAPGPGHVQESHSSASGNPQNSGDPQSRSGSQQQDGQRPRQQSNRPAWVEELESSTGEIYGIGN